MTKEKMNKLVSKVMTIAVMTIGFLFVGGNEAMAQQIVGNAGAGESGASSVLYHQVTGNSKKVMVFRTTKSSLCPNTGAVVVLVVNGEPVKHGNISAKGESIEVNVDPKDNVIAIVHTIPLFNEIQCIMLGEIDFTLEQRDLD